LSGTSSTPRCIGYSNLDEFKHRRESISTMDDLWRALQVLEKEPQSFVVRGDVKANFMDEALVNRRKHEHEGKAAPSLQANEQGHAWLMIDVDKFTLPQGADPIAAPEAAIEVAVRNMPPYLHDATYVWRLSASAGIKGRDVLSAHLWLLMDGPVPDDTLKTWAEGVNAATGVKLLDPRVYVTTQPLYTAKPLFEAEMSDPVPRRMGIVKKSCDRVSSKAILDDATCKMLSTPATHPLPDLQQALSYIPADDRETWLKVGLALHDEIGSESYALWEEWSRSCPGKFDEEDCARTWGSFVGREPGHKVTVKTIYWLARQNGWQDTAQTWVDELNTTYFVAHDGGTTSVFHETHDVELSRLVVRRRSFKSFEEEYCNRHVFVGYAKTKGKEDTDKPIYKPLGRAWLEHQRRRQYRGLAFLPGEVAPAGIYNFWRGWAVEPKQGDWSHFRAHIEDIICSGDKSASDYLIGWMARAIQLPGNPGEVAVALRGGKGTGKSVFAHLFGQLFGNSYLQVASPQHLTGRFNGHLRDACVLFADESFWGGDKAGESVLKVLITEPTLAIEGKGRDLVTVRNRLHVILASNADWIVPASVDERRFFVLDVSDMRQQDKEYFRRIHEQMASGGAAAMLYDLMHMDIAAFDVSDIPQTAALARQKLESLDVAGRWLYERLVRGYLLAPSDWDEVAPTTFAVHLITEDFQRYAVATGRSYRGDSTALGRRLSELLGVERSRLREGGARVYSWTFPPLPGSRRRFSEALGLPGDEWGSARHLAVAA
jgi:hypothetical protein